MRIYVIIFKHNNQLADNFFFSSFEEAWEFKKTRIAEGYCLNPISMYDVTCLSPA
jgi:hypothetical protein